MSYFRDHLGKDPRRTALGVPLLLSGKVIGVINLYRDFVEPFTDRQVALVETFADQAVIAIENARLFEAEQSSKQELTQSLEYQTAISEVLSVISAERWQEALAAGVAPRVVLAATHEATLEIAELKDLKRHALDLA